MKTPSLSTSYKGLFSISAISLLLTLSACGGSSSDRPELSISLPGVVEGDNGTVELVFTVTLSEDAEKMLTADYTTTDGSATVADNDYTAATGSITIPEGSRTATVSVFANGDDDFELDESFNLVVSNAQGVRLEESSYSGQGLIENDDDAESEGYFNGTATLNSIAYNDMTGMMYDDRLMMFSPTANALYDIEFTDVNINDFTATASIYVNGDITDTASRTNVSLSGTTDEATIHGTFSGSTGLGEGSFTLTFDTNNNEGATLPRIEATGFDQWEGNIYGVDNDPSGTFDARDTGVYNSFDSNQPSCGTTTGAILVIPDSELNIYQLNHDVIERNLCTYISTGHTGLASVLSINPTDTLVYAYANGSISLFAVMTK